MKASTVIKPNREFQAVIDRYNILAERVAVFVAETSHPMPIHEASRAFGVTVKQIQYHLYYSFYQANAA